MEEVNTDHQKMVEWMAKEIVESITAFIMRSVFRSNSEAVMLGYVSSRIVELFVPCSEALRKTVDITDQNATAKKVLAEMRKLCGLPVQAEAPAEVSPPAGK